MTQLKDESKFGIFDCILLYSEILTFLVTPSCASSEFLLSLLTSSSVYYYNSNDLNVYISIKFSFTNNTRGDFSFDYWNCLKILKFTKEIDRESNRNSKSLD